MTEQEATKRHIAECRERILKIKRFAKSNKDADVEGCEENIFVLKNAMQSLEELEQYRALGTVEELKEAMEKQVAKKPIETEHFNCLNYECPICEGGLFHEQQYCDECGQALKWGEEDEQG